MHQKVFVSSRMSEDRQGTQIGSIKQRNGIDLAALAARNGRDTVLYRNRLLLFRALGYMARILAHALESRAVRLSSSLRCCIDFRASVRVLVAARAEASMPFGRFPPLEDERRRKQAPPPRTHGCNAQVVKTSRSGVAQNTSDDISSGSPA